MNVRDSQNINFFNALILFSVLVIFWRLFMLVWHRSQLGAILLITFGPYLLLSINSYADELQYRVICQIKPEQDACKR